MQTIVEPTLAADRHGLPIWYQALDGPVTGALTFRVGIGDEPLVRRGFTHMVEHLALNNINDQMIQWNGYVDLKVDEATRGLEGLSPAELGDIKQVLKEQMVSDPGLVDLVRTATGQLPSPPPEET